MLELGMIKQELINEAMQLAIVLVLLYHTFIESRANKQKNLFFLAFAAYALFLLPHMYTRAVQAGFLSPGYQEISALFSHAFKTMFFMLFGYATLYVLVLDATLKRILRSTTISAFLILFTISTGTILIGGRDLVFNDTINEFTYELLEMAIQIILINIFYHAWIDTRSRNLLLLGGAFILFFIADAAHAYSLIWGFSEVLFSLRHVLRLGALLLLAYTFIFYGKK